ncbi:MAG TPA: serine hydrolase, partial [Aggregatilineales bacterium]|nr:serine hydrolase [Aggregatilineales bacterium]
MTLGGLGTREQQTAGFPVLRVLSGIALLVGILLLGIELVVYSSRDVNSLQDDVMIAGIQVGGLSENQAQLRWEAVYLDQPVTLIYRNSPIMFSPRTLGFRTNTEAMLAEVRAQTENEDTFWSGFWAYLWNRQSRAVRVELNAAVQEGQLRSVLEDIGARYDTGPGSVGFDPATLTFMSGSSGSRLDVNASIDLIRQTLFNPVPAERTIELPTQGVTAGNASIEDLREGILAYMESQGFLYDGATTIGSVFVMDLSTGEEISILGDVAHSAVSTIKIPIMINFFRHQVTAPDP